jgi:5-methylcytosine-specific restriction endonuclease McrA
MSTLILNADAQPTNFLPLSVISWQEAIRYIVLEKASPVYHYENWWVRSPSWETQVPAVIMLREYQKPKRSIRLSKKNVYLRDNFTCQYCGDQLNDKTLSIDHVIPVSKGGRNRWDNLTTSCRKCNSHKSDKAIKPETIPYKPDYWELVAKRKQRGYDIKHSSWLEFIG